MKVTIMADEISPGLETALELMRSWNLDTVELRRAGERRYPDVSDYWRSRIPRLVKELGFSVVAISPGLFKVDYPGPDAPLRFLRAPDMDQFADEEKAKRLLDQHVNKLLPDSIEAAKALGAQTIICWSFQSQEHGPTPEGAVQILRHAAAQAAAGGVQLLIEVSDWASRTADLVRRVDHPALAISWTPASAYAAGDHTSFPDGYAQVRPFVRHVHFKDVIVKENGDYEWAMNGLIDWAGQIKALAEDGYDGYISVEPHVRPKIDGVMKTLDRLRGLIREASPSAEVTLAH
jgi:sugar phosphate isomerase/epimerase